MKTIVYCLLTTLVLLSGSVYAAERPHIILIMVDDMGFSDLGYHGGEINTPHLDALAHGGVRFSQFYNSGRCCPTRATLMTGLHPHQTGIGWMTQSSNSNRGSGKPPAYQGYLNRQCVTIAEVLREHGYATLMAGKWHLGQNDRDRWPLQRGFDKYYGCVPGALRLFHPEHPRGITFGNEQIKTPSSTTDDEFYTTDAFTDYAIQFLQEEAEEAQRPAFLYLAYNAPHWPLQAFEDDIARYRGKYNMGWDKLRERRHRRQIELGLIDATWKLSPRTPGIPAWDTLDEKKQDEMDLKMAVYAAMIDRIDQNIGRLVTYLKNSGRYNDTLILFLSDNGGCQEGGMLGRGEFYDVAKRNLEDSNSYGEAWANASNTPFRLYKHFAHEGGAATPFFMHWPAKIAASTDWFADPAQLIDVLPTILDVAGAKYPAQAHGNNIPALDGVSLRPAFGTHDGLPGPSAAQDRDGPGRPSYKTQQRRPLGRKTPIFIEHENNAFVRDGDWKLVGRGVAANSGVDPEKWELYNMAWDRTETNNLASAQPDRVQELAAKWNQWAERVDVYPKNRSNPKPSKPQPTADPNPPQVKGRAFTITATIRHAKPRGVVVSHGGARFGYSLHFVNRRPAFAVRNEGQLTELIADKPVKGKVKIKATIDAQTMSISVNGKSVATRESPGLLTDQPGIGLYAGLDFKDAVGGYQVPNRFNGTIVRHSVAVEIPGVAMRTKWGETVTAENVWQEYPRPAMKRDKWTNLNGHWNYAVTGKKVNDAPAKWAGEILVPFAIEAPLSGVEQRFSPDHALWYRRSFPAEKKDDRRYRLNFEAVDYQSTLWVNGKKIGSHTGGNLPFSFDITDALVNGKNTITLRVTDATDSRGTYQLHGKQRLNPKGIWYTPVSGIWQTVWLEDVPEVHITGLKITTRIDGRVSLNVTHSGRTMAFRGRREAVEKARSTALEGHRTVITASLDGKEVARAEGTPDSIQFAIPNPKLWSPNSPTLYDLKIELGDDVVHSYVGLREVGRQQDADGHWRFTLNGKEIFHWGTLDQGWWPDGLLTPPSDDAMRSDVEFLKAAGFNMIRKHIKVEPRRFYYHCDRIGMMLWQDQVSNRDPAGDPKWTRLQPNPQTVTWPDGAHQQFMAELKGMIDLLHNHPSIVQWVPFNEAWGQHQTVEVGKWVTGYDPTRHVNVASGGNFLPAGHIVDHHEYPHPKFPFDLGKGGRFSEYFKVMGEFGGHGFPVEGHVWDPQTRNWGYGGLPENKDEWLERYRTSINMLAELKQQGIAAGIYTQTTDVEGEINGLITYDRKVQKLAPEKLAEIHQAAGLTK